MFDTYLIPQNTVLTAKGDGGAIDVSSASQRVFLATLRISEVVEQEAIDVAVFSSTDGVTWDVKPLMSFPQKFYKGETPILLDLGGRGDVRFLRAHWEVNRWGRGPEEPRFIVDVRIREVPADILAEAQQKAKNH